MREFLKLESARGMILVIAAVMAMLIANSPLAHDYNMLIEMPVEVRVGPLELAKPLLQNGGAEGTPAGLSPIS